MDDTLDSVAAFDVVAMVAPVKIATVAIIVAKIAVELVAAETMTIGAFVDAKLVEKFAFAIEWSAVG